MEKLLEINHSISQLNNSSIKTWCYNIDNSLFLLTYEIKNFNILTRLKGVSVNKNYNITKFHVKDIKNQSYIIINDINEWLNKHLIYIENSSNIYIKTLKLIDYVKNSIGNNTFQTSFEIGWNIPDILTLTIKFYETYNNKLSILLLYKNEEVLLSEQKLKTFINVNKENILNAMRNIKIKNKIKIKKYNQDREEENKIERIKLEELLLSKKIKNTMYNGTELFINKSNKELYVEQACKPFPTQYPWEN